MKCLTKCTDRTVRLFPCLKDNNTIINRISSTKSFKLDRISGFASFIKKIGKGRDGGVSVKTTENESSNGDQITVSEIELREWSEPNPALGIKEEEDELSISSNSFMKTAPPAPRRSKDIENDRIAKRIELTSMNENKSKTIQLEEMKHEMKQMKHEMKQMKQDKQFVEQQLHEQTKQMKQKEMKQMKQQKQQKQEKERFQREKEENEQRHQDQIHEMQQTLKKMKTDNSFIAAKLAITKNKKYTH